MLRSLHPSRKPILYLTLLSILLHGVPLFAGAWVQEKGAFYLKIWTTGFSTEDEFDLQGERRPLYYYIGSWRRTSLEERSAGIYAEYGLTRRFTLVATLPWKQLTRKATDILEPVSPHIRNHSSGIGDLAMGVRLHLFSNFLVSSIQVMVRIPGGYEVGPPPTQLADNPHLPLGTGVRALSLEALAGHSSSRWYTTGSLGYRFQDGRLKDEILYTLEFGFYPISSLVIQGTVDGIRTRARQLRLPLGTSIVMDQDLLKMGLGLIWSPSSYIELSLIRISHFLGRNAPAASQMIIGLALKG